VTDGASAEPISAALAAQLATVTEERDEYKKLVRHLREENERLKRGLLGQKAERLPANDTQLSLMMIGLAFGASSAPPPAAPPPEQIVAEHKRRKPVRKPLPEDLPRVQIEIVPPRSRAQAGRLPAYRDRCPHRARAAALGHRRGRNPV